METAAPILTVSHVSRVFPDGTSALRDVSFSVAAGDFLVIAGSNGSGKSVLMSIIASLDDPTEGTVTLAGDRGSIRAGLVFQNADAQILGETPEEDVAFGPRNKGLRKKALADCVDAALDRCGLLHKKSASARLMSGGEKRRLAVAGVLALECPLIIFDEPFANLDWPGVRQVCAILEQLKADGKTVIVLTHELEKVLGLANRFMVLDRGAIRFDGTPDGGLGADLAQWGIHDPRTVYRSAGDMVWR